jgi:hypothetical protein
VTDISYTLDSQTSTEAEDGDSKNSPQIQQLKLHVSTCSFGVFFEHSCNDKPATLETRTNVHATLQARNDFGEKLLKHRK